jgi:cytochrome P450
VFSRLLLIAGNETTTNLVARMVTTLLDRFDITRKTTGHLGFGFGAHFCLAAHLARLETRTAMDGILRRLPNLHVIRLSEEKPVLTGGAVGIHPGFDAPS